MGLLLSLYTGYQFDSNSFSSTDVKTLTFHKMIEAFKFAYAKRAYLGDEDFVNVNEVGVY